MDRGVVRIECKWLSKGDVADLLNEVRALRKLDDAVYAEIAAEREAQDRQWGIQDHAPEHWLVILGEEFGEACEALLEGDLAAFRHELVQVAAVSVAVIEALGRNDG